MEAGAVNKIGFAAGAKPRILSGRSCGAPWPIAYSQRTMT
jgi:hypothetical protein